MNTYKIIFARNEVLVCLETTSHIPEGRTIHVEHNEHGMPIYALVEAADIPDACNKARSMVRGKAYPQSIGDPSSTPVE